MKNLIKILILLQLFGCNNFNDKKANVDTKDTSFVFENRYIRLDSFKIQEYEKLAEYNFDKALDKTKLIVNINDTLKLTIDSVKSVIFINEGDGDEVRKYKHIGNLAGYYVIEAFYWESGEYFLVNKNSGEKYSMQAPPYLSPNCKYFVTFSRTGDYDIMPTILQVWKLEKEKLTEIVNMDMYKSKLGIDEARWMTDNELAVHLNFDNRKFAYCKLKIK